MRLVVSVALLALLTACGSGSSSEPTAAPASTPTTGDPTSEATTRPPCPNPEGQFCLGKLDAGTYGTVQFQPAITYTVPAGWSNFEDMAGNFLLVPPAGNLKGVDAATSDFIGVYSTVLAHANVCPSAPANGVGTTPAAIMKWYQRDPAFRASPPQPVTVGGLSGLVTTLRMAPGWKTTCPYSHGQPIAPLIVGSGSTFLDHNLIPGQATRLYLLKGTTTEGQPAALAIEVVDIHDAGHLAAYSTLVEQLEFGA